MLTINSGRRQIVREIKGERERERERKRDIIEMKRKDGINNKFDNERKLNFMI